MTEIATTQLRTIKYIQRRVEQDLPHQIELAEQVLGRMTLKHYGQLQFDFGEAEV